MVNPIKRNISEVQQRPKVVSEARQAISKLKESLEQIKTSHPWITEE